MFGNSKKYEDVPQDITDKCNIFLPELEKISDGTKRPGFWESFGPYGKKQVATIIDVVGV